MTRKHLTTIDDILTYMSLATQGKNKWGKFHNVPLNYFSPAFVLHVEGDDVSTKLRSEDYLESWGAFTDVQFSDLENPNIDLCIFQDAIEEEKAEGTKYQITRTRVMTPKEKRPYFFSGFPALEQTSAFIKEDGSFITGKTFTVKTGSKWTHAVNAEYPSQRYGDDATENVKIVCGVIFTQYFEWTVTLGYPGYPHITFNCTPQGARDVFKLRDIPEGKQRRSAIHHWVGEHRRRKTESDEYINIMDYLRGRTQFNWNGLNCIIKPSESDIKRYLKLHPNKQYLAA